METAKKEKLFYGWVVVAGCMIMRLGLGIPNYSLSVFLKPMCAALDVSRGVFSAYSTFSYIATMVMLPILGVWFKKFNFKLLMWIGAIVTTVVLYCYSFVTSVWQFYLLSTLNGLFGGMLNSIPIAMLTANWFKEKRGFATGLAFTGSGISAMFVAPLANYLIENMSWMISFRVIACMYLVFVFVPLIFIIKVKPEDMGLVAYGNEKLAANAPIKPLTGFTSKEAMKTSTFWILAICMFATGFVYMGTQNHVVSYLSDIGHSTTFATGMYSIIMAFDTVGKIVLGMLYDKMGLRKTNIYIYSLLFSAEILLIFAANSSVAIVFSIILGMSVAVQTGAYPIIINTLLGDKAYSQIYGNLTVFYFAGMSLGIPFSGIIYDMFSSYIPAWCGYVVAIAIVLFLLLLAEKRSKADWRRLNSNKV